MTTPRNRLIDYSITDTYHCSARCVRRAFLLGYDQYSGRSFEHRRQWILDMLHLLTSVFSIELYSYSIMENHYHLVLHVDKVEPIKWSIKEIFSRWTKLHKPDELVKLYLAGRDFQKADELKVAKLAAEYRRRLMDISWFMRELNETIARRANKEDGCTGRFWESRFKSQALLDESSVLSCMAYVDLNPIRAGMCETPEESDYTSIQRRIRQILGEEDEADLCEIAKFSKPCSGKDTSPLQLITAEQYVALVDWTGRFIRQGKRGFIPNELAPILTRLGLDEDEWLIRTKYFHCRFRCVAGFWETIVKAAQQLKRHWFQGKPSNKLQI